MTPARQAGADLHDVDIVASGDLDTQRSGRPTTERVPGPGRLVVSDEAVSPDAVA
jgi:hypothetical protein